jgi:hypothetical protein
MKWPILFAMAAGLMLAPASVEAGGVNHVLRWLGLGYSDGYHACNPPPMPAVQTLMVGPGHWPAAAPPVMNGLPRPLPSGPEDLGPSPSDWLPPRR